MDNGETTRTRDNIPAKTSDADDDGRRYVAHCLELRRHRGAGSRDDWELLDYPSKTRSVEVDTDQRDFQIVGSMK